MEIGLHVFMEGFDFRCRVRKFSKWLEVNDVSSTCSRHVGPGVDELLVCLTWLLVVGQPVAEARFWERGEIIFCGEGSLEFG